MKGLFIDDLEVRRGERTLFSGLSFSVLPGEAVALSGRNGAGKTSLLRAVAGFLRPASGAVRFDGGDPDEIRSRDVHWIGHQDGLRGARTAREELQFWTRWTGGGPACGDAAAERFGLGPLLDLEVRRLSAGQRRRLALARLVASPRPLWLLDEPLGPLDAERRQAFGWVMTEHLSGGGMILAAVHDPLPVTARAVEVGG